MQSALCRYVRVCEVRLYMFFCGSRVWATTKLWFKYS